MPRAPTNLTKDSGGLFSFPWEHFQKHLEIAFKALQIPKQNIWTTKVSPKFSPGCLVPYGYWYPRCRNDIKVELSWNPSMSVPSVHGSLVKQLLILRKPIWANFHYSYCLKSYLRGWRDGSVLKSIHCSFQDSKFNSQPPHDISQLSDAVFWCSEVHAKYSYIKYINKSFLKKLF